MNNQIQLFTSTLEVFNKTDISKKKNSLFFITDTKELYFEDQMYKEPLVIALDLNIENPIVGTMYYNQSDSNIYTYTGTEFKLLIEEVSTVQSLDPVGTEAVSGSAVINYLLENPIELEPRAINSFRYEDGVIYFDRSNGVASSIAFTKVLANVVYDEESKVMYFKDSFNTDMNSIALLDNYIVSGEYSITEKALIFTMTDNTKVKIPASDLIKLYTAQDGKCLETIIENTSNGNTIRMNVLKSAQPGNIITTNADGFYIQYTEFNNKLDLLDKNFGNRIIVAKNDGNVKPSIIIGTDTLNTSNEPSSYIVATEKAVSIFTEDLADKIFLNKENISTVRSLNKALSADMNAPRYNHVMISPTGIGSVMAVGGEGNNGNTLFNCEEYNNFVWSESEAWLNESRSQSTASFYDNKVFGGYNAPDNGEQYNPVDKTWTVLECEMNGYGDMYGTGSISSGTSNYITYEDTIQVYNNLVFSIYDIAPLMTYRDAPGFVGGELFPSTSKIKGLLFGGLNDEPASTERFSETASEMVAANFNQTRIYSSYLGNTNATTAYVYGGYDDNNDVWDSNSIDTVEKFNNELWSVEELKLLVTRQRSFAWSKQRDSLQNIIITGGSPELEGGYPKHTSEEIVQYFYDGYDINTLYKYTTGSNDLVVGEKLVKKSFKEAYDDVYESNKDIAIETDNIISVDTGGEYFNRAVVTNHLNSKDRNSFGCGIAIDNFYVYGGVKKDGVTRFSGMEKIINGIWVEQPHYLNIPRSNFAYSGDNVMSFCTEGRTSFDTNVLDTELFDYISGWKIGQNSSIAKYDSCSTMPFKNNSLFLVMGGKLSSGTFYDSVQYLNNIFSAVTHWSTKPNLLKAKARCGSFGTSINSYGIIGGCTSTLNYIVDFDMCNSGVWTKKPDLLVALSNPAVYADHDTIIVISGNSAISPPHQIFNGIVWSMFDGGIKTAVNIRGLGDINNIVIFNNNGTDQMIKFKTNDKSQNIPNEEFVSKYFSWKEI